MKTNLATFLFDTALVGTVPTSTLLASAEGDAAGASGGGGTAAPAGAPAATTTTTAPATGAPATSNAPATAPAASPTSERMIPESEVNRIVQDRLARDRQSRGGTEAPARPAEHRPAPAQTEAQRLDRIEAENALFRAASRAGVNLSEAQEIDLLDLYRTQRPEQPGVWFDLKVAAFNLKPPALPALPAAPATTTNPAAPAAPAAPQGAVASTAPGPVAGAATGALLDVTRMSKAELDALGPDGVVKAMKAVLDAGRSASGRPALPSLANRRNQ